MKNTIFYKGAYIAKGSPMYDLLTQKQTTDVRKQVDNLHASTMHNFRHLYGEDNAKAMEAMSLEFHLKAKASLEKQNVK